MKIGLFFGSFNPIHVGHLFVAEIALERAELDEVWFVISPASPYKMDTGELADERSRLIMALNAIEYNSKLRVSNLEFSLPYPSYTSVSLEEFKRLYPEDSFSLICGTDVYVDIPNWKFGQEVIDAVDFIVYPRSSATTYSPEEMKEKTLWLDAVSTLEISSTYIRNQIKNNKTTMHILPEKVKEYITANNLYK
jgi:nicotinate-nucleotide adenylyltransferase